MSQRFNNLAAAAAAAATNPKVSKEKKEIGGGDVHQIKINSNNNISSNMNSNKAQLSSGSNTSNGSSNGGHNSSASSKSETLSPPNPASSSLISSFLSGLPFPTTSVFPPLIDMTSTQALVTLVSWKLAVLWVLWINKGYTIERVNGKALRELYNNFIKLNEKNTLLYYCLNKYACSNLKIEDDHDNN